MTLYAQYSCISFNYPSGGIIQCNHEGVGNPEEYIINGVANNANKIPEISLNLLTGILSKIRFPFTANPTNNPIGITAPNKAPLISTNVNAASIDEFSIDSIITRWI